MKPKKNPRSISCCRFMRFAIVLSCIALSGRVVADDGSCYLNLYGTSSAFDQSYPVEEVLKVTFTTESLTVHFVDNPAYVDLLYTDLSKITFGDGLFTDVSAIQATDLRISYRSSLHTVTVESDLPITQVTVYNMQGVMLQHTTPHNEHVDLDLSGYPSGICIVRAVSGEETVTKKIIR